MEVAGYAAGDPNPTTREITLEAPNTPDNAPLPPPTFVDDDAGFAVLMELMRGADEIAIDTEADSFFHYQEKVSLIQVTVGDEDFVLDPLAKFDLSGLGEILADPSKIKIFHDGEYDVLILKRDFDFNFAGLFDTRVAAAALGTDKPGLASVVAARFGVELDKSQQRSDWSRRPLTPEQIEYARQDTRYLVPMMHQMKAELEAMGRTEILEGECRRLEALVPAQRKFNPDEFMKIKGVRALDLKSMAVLRELFIWRNTEARDRDVPAFKVLGNVPLMELARLAPQSLSAMERVKGLSPKVIRRLGNELLHVIQSGRDAGPLDRVPKLPAKDGTGKLDEAQQELHDRFKSWRRDRASKEGLDSSLVLNRHTLLSLASMGPKSSEQLRDVEGIQPWQIRMFGDELLQLVARFEADRSSGAITFGRRRERRRSPSVSPFQ